MQNIVISGINIFQAGAMTVFKDLLNEIIKLKYYSKYKITILVYKKELFKEYIDYVEIIEFPKSKKSYLFRLYYEYVFFYFFSKKRSIDVWLSLHDTTPNVIARKRYVYCHNPLPFMDKKTIDYLHLGFGMKLYRILYKYIYRINIRKNNAVIVQQEWIRKEFKKAFGISNIVVARPVILTNPKESNNTEQTEKEIATFIYPSFPRLFKNFEIICRADQILEQRGIKCRIVLTVPPEESKEGLYSRYKHLKNIRWRGLIDKETLEEEYKESDCMIFPSLLETWGLPISEYKRYNKPIICANLPYAHETVGSYETVKFFDPLNDEELANIMESFVNKTLKYDNNQYEQSGEIVFDTWKDLLEYMM